MWSKTEVAERHTREWENYRESILLPALSSREEKECKVAKILADCIRLIQDGERRAWAFSADERPAPEAEYCWEE